MLLSVDSWGALSVQVLHVDLRSPLLCLEVYEDRLNDEPDKLFVSDKQLQNLIRIAREAWPSAPQAWSHGWGSQPKLHYSRASQPKC